VSSSVKKNANSKGKGTSIPVQAWASQEGSRRLKIPYFETIEP